MVFQELYKSQNGFSLGHFRGDSDGGGSGSEVPIDTLWLEGFYFKTIISGDTYMRHLENFLCDTVTRLSWHIDSVYVEWEEPGYSRYETIMKNVNVENLKAYINTSRDRKRGKMLPDSIFRFPKKIPFYIYANKLSMVKIYVVAESYPDGYCFADMIGPYGYCRFHFQTWGWIGPTYYYYNWISQGLDTRSKFTPLAGLKIADFGFDSTGDFGLALFDYTRGSVDSLYFHTTYTGE